MEGSGASRRPLSLTNPCLTSCSCRKEGGRGGRGSTAVLYARDAVRRPELK